MPQPPTESRRDQVPLVRRPGAEVAAFVPARDVPAELLPKLDLEDYVPSVRPWLRIGTTAVVASVALGVGFMVVCPYRVVVRAQGSVRPAGEQVLVNAPFEGRVVSIDVSTNESIEAGQPMVTLDRSRLRGEVFQYDQSQSALARQVKAQLAQAEAEAAKAKLEVEKAESALRFAQSEFDRYEGLAQEGAASMSLYEGKLANLNQARATLEQAVENLSDVRSQAQNREAELEKEIAAIVSTSAEARRNLGKTTVRAPVSGIVFRLQVSNAMQTIAAGQELAMITPSNAERLVKVNVRSEDVETVRPGQQADLRIAGCPYPDFGTLRAEVVAVSPDALPMGGGTLGTEGTAVGSSQLYEVTLKPEQTFLTSQSRRCEVKIGMPLQADIVTREETLMRFVLRKTRIFVGQ
ncbi:HlyD family efflux transporter periplasmic adaptor subunit [Synechococcus sp. BSF8S]|uniref:HlyD family secretion protein n=1 Tax=Synechococcales TaxID=1890424 RepID=UPI001629A312|nr:MULTISPECIES: HlyD family efflux transporter periplasmic adaptor subunit [unclassified Synechococcus]MBC1262504.1 HlyD family efflux transporter periplasmic adaptor subunit [Synechococcus sp. BSF8S]MBC1265386.1 HlyD family efflux transporter periplasmic adaptor subunit [Synechococcus sp. BSA11S]